MTDDPAQPGRVPPKVVIELELEAAPRVRLVEPMTDDDLSRLLDWLKANDDLDELVARAVELSREARREAST